MRSNGRPLAADIVLGAAAGAAATWAMDAVTTLLYEREPEQVKKRENKARGSKTPYEKIAEKLSAGKAQRKRIGSAIHWSIGVSSGALYGLLRNRSRYVGLGFPWQAHARGLAGHLVLGAILDGVFDVADLIV